MSCTLYFVESGNHQWQQTVVSLALNALFPSTQPGTKLPHTVCQTLRKEDSPGPCQDLPGPHIMHFKADASSLSIFLHFSKCKYRTSVQGATVTICPLPFILVCSIGNSTFVI